MEEEDLLGLFLCRGKAQHIEAITLQHPSASREFIRVVNTLVL